MDRYTKTISTKVFDEGDAVSTEFTVDVSQLTDDDKVIIIASAAAIKRQGVWRRKGVIPTAETYVVQKPGTRGTGAITRAALLRKLLGDKYDAVIQKYGGVDEAYTALNSFFDETDETDEIVVETE